MRIEKFWGKIWAICWKDIKIYYLKGPVVVMGILFPLFLWLSFYAGKGLDIREGLASLLTMTLFFTSSSITPIIAPWETRQRTLEMLLSRPVTITIILFGDIMASTIFGMIFGIIPIIFGVILGIWPSNILLALAIIFLMSLGFSSLGVLFSALPTDIPADVVLLSSIIKLPLIFVSGVLIPLNSLPKWILPVSLISPLTYPTDILKIIYTGKGYLTPLLDIFLTILFTFIFLLAALKLHKKTIPLRLQRK